MCHFKKAKYVTEKKNILFEIVSTFGIRRILPDLWCVMNKFLSEIIFDNTSFVWYGTPRIKRNIVNWNEFVLFTFEFFGARNIIQMTSQTVRFYGCTLTILCLKELGCIFRVKHLGMISFDTKLISQFLMGNLSIIITIPRLLDLIIYQKF